MRFRESYALFLYFRWHRCHLFVFVLCCFGVFCCASRVSRIIRLFAKWHQMRDECCPLFQCQTDWIKDLYRLILVHIQASIYKNNVRICICILAFLWKNALFWHSVRMFNFYKRSFFEMASYKMPSIDYHMNSYNRAPV